MAIEDFIDASLKEDRQRTKLQNRALHKWFKQVSDALISMGMTSDRAFSSMEIVPTPEVVKSAWKQVQQQLLSKESTTELTTKEIDMVYDVINKVLAEGESHLHIPFPNMVDLLNNTIEVPHDKRY